MSSEADARERFAFAGGGDERAIGRVGDEEIALVIVRRPNDVPSGSVDARREGDATTG